MVGLLGKAVSAVVVALALWVGGHLLAMSVPARVASLRVVSDPHRVTGSLAPGGCHYRAGGALPDPACTPGSIEPGATVAVICAPGYSEAARPPEAATEAFKYGTAYPAYGTPARERTELDHLVPLELGGSNDASNLWPESPPSPNPKDAVEDALHRAVCDGRVSLPAAQRAIAEDWQTALAVTGATG